MQECFQYNYEGDWKVVQDILEQPEDALVFTLETLMNYKDSFFIFGNLLPLMKRLSRGFRVRTYYLSVVDDTRPVTLSVWRRGYNDKGTLPDPQKLGIEYFYLKREPKEDLRNKVWNFRKHQWLRKDPNKK